MKTNEEIFTSQYLEHLKRLDISENVYRITPNEYSKKILDDLKSKVFTSKERFTPEYIKEYQESKKVAENKAEEEIKHILNAMHIEELFDNGKISIEKRFLLHDNNDNKFNLKYAL